MAMFGTLLKARNDVRNKLWHDVARRRRAGQAFTLGEPAWWMGPPPICSPLATCATTGWPGRQDKVPRKELLTDPGPAPGANASPLTIELAA